MDVPFDPEPYFNNPTFSDVEIRFSNRAIMAHRIFLCSKSPYFQKALGPDSQFKENDDGVLELKEDDPIVVEEMLRYVYTSTYREAYNGYWDSQKVTWETHLNVMIVADKYGLPNLETLAFDKCKAEVKKGEIADDVLFRLVERSWEYADQDGRFAALIAGLPEMSGDRFLYLFEDEKVRAWVDANPAAARPLIEKHFRMLMKLGSFREKISGDGKMALEHLDRLLRFCEFR